MDAIIQNNALDGLTAFVTSLAVGLLMGLERERTPSAKAGLRTFTLIALLGTLSAMIAQEAGSPLVLAAGFVIVGLFITAAYLRDPEDDDPGTTTVAALLLCYGLGAIIWYGYSTLAIMVGIVVTILLYFKPELRGISQSLTRRDLLSILQFAVLSFIVLPILPDREFGPYLALNPHQIWLMVVLISGLSLAGYVALKWSGRRYGVALLGLMGGLASSTATTLIYARHGKDNENLARMAVGVILLANLVVQVRLAVVGATVAPDILPRLLPVLGGGLALGLAVVAWWWRQMEKGRDLPLPEIQNPTELRASVGFGLLYAVVLFCSAWLQDYAGNKGLYVVALVSGLTDVDAMTLTSLRLFNTGRLAAGDAVTAITLAVVANLTFKLGVVFAIGGRALGRRCAAGLGAIALGSLLALWLQA
jgi:Predicted membrane protein